jgi:ubiquinone/menaquinone biosynthesis C-methylase UbiE
MSNSTVGSDYVRAAGKRGSVRIYDTVLKLSAREGRWRSALLDRAAAGIPRDGTAVDVGAGTGTFAIALARRRPDVTAIAVDGDESILELARAKLGSERVDWRAGLANELPLEDESADTVTMSLVLHHLSPRTKRAALAEARRVLRPGGQLHVADWGPQTDPAMRLAFRHLLQRVDGVRNTQEHADGLIPGIIAGAGFTHVRSYDRLRTIWGSLELLVSER